MFGLEGSNDWCQSGELDQRSRTQAARLEILSPYSQHPHGGSGPSMKGSDPYSGVQVHMQQSTDTSDNK